MDNTFKRFAMDEVFYRENLPSADEYNLLRINAGWGAMPVAVVEKSFKNTLFGIAVYRENKIIGTGRVVGDGGLCFYIQDTIVSEPWRKQGVGSEIISRILHYLEKTLHTTVISG